MDYARAVESLETPSRVVETGTTPDRVLRPVRRISLGAGGELAAVAGELDVNEDTPFWALVDEVSRLRDLGESELDLVGDILRVVAEHRAHRGRARFR